MRSIFSRATRVYMWLGPGNDDSNEAMDFISRVGPQAFSSDVLNMLHDKVLVQQIQSYLTSLRSSGDTSSEVSVANYPEANNLARLMVSMWQENSLYPGKDSELTRLVRGIKDVLRRDYWHRIWIVQEVVLSKEATVLCGVKGVALS